MEKKNSDVCLRYTGDDDEDNDEDQEENHDDDDGKQYRKIRFEHDYEKIEYEIYEHEGMRCSSNRGQTHPNVPTRFQITGFDTRPSSWSSKP